MIPTWAVVPTKNRGPLVRQLLTSLVGQVEGVVVVDNNDVPDLFAVDGMCVINVHRPGFPPNLSELLNVGMDAVPEGPSPDRWAAGPAGDEEWNVVLLNDDVICPPGWVESLSDAMRATSAVMAYTDRLNRAEQVLYTTPPPEQAHSATVWACMLRGEANVRFDETMKWWYSDNDLDNVCRRSGGVLAVPGRIPEHLHPSEQTVASVELSTQAQLDRETFDRKWSGVPW